MSRYEPAGVYNETVLYTGITTSDGVIGGTTLIDSALIGVNDFVTDTIIIIKSGVCRRETRDISSFTNVSGTITVGTAFSAKIVSGVSFTIVARMSADVEVADLQADVGDASVSTLGSLYGILGNPSASVDTTLLNGIDNRANNPTLNALLGVPDVAGKDLYTCLITDRLDNGTYGLSALETLVDSLEQRIVTTTSMMEFWSALDDIITLTTATSNVNLPDVTITDIPTNTTIVRVVGMIKMRALNNTNAATNAINGASVINIKKSTGAWAIDDVLLINIADNIWSTAASTKEGGMLIEGYNDASTEVDGNATYNLRFNGNIFVDGNNLELIDVIVGLKVYFIAT